MSTGSQTAANQPQQVAQGQQQAGQSPQTTAATQPSRNPFRLGYTWWSDHLVGMSFLVFLLLVGLLIYVVSYFYKHDERVKQHIDDSYKAIKQDIAKGLDPNLVAPTLPSSSKPKPTLVEQLSRLEASTKDKDPKVVRYTKKPYSKLTLIYPKQMEHLEAALVRVGGSSTSFYDQWKAKALDEIKKQEDPNFQLERITAVTVVHGSDDLVMGALVYVIGKENSTQDVTKPKKPRKYVVIIRDALDADKTEKWLVEADSIVNLDHEVEYEYLDEKAHVPLPSTQVLPTGPTR